MSKSIPLWKRFIRPFHGSAPVLSLLTFLNDSIDPRGNVADLTTNPGLHAARSLVRAWVICAKRWGDRCVLDEIDTPAQYDLQDLSAQFQRERVSSAEHGTTVVSSISTQWTLAERILRELRPVIDWLQSSKTNACRLRHCKECRRWYLRVRSSRQFCSDACRLRARDPRVRAEYMRDYRANPIVKARKA